MTKTQFISSRAAIVADGQVEADLARKRAKLAPRSPPIR